MSDAVLNPCCVAEDSPHRVLWPNHPDARPGVEVFVCDVCGRRHFVATLDPGELGLAGAGF